MKKTVILLIFSLFAFASCDKDTIEGESIFTDVKEEEKNAFDLWLDRHYVEPYNIRFEYRMPDIETGMNYWVSPPRLDKSIEVAKSIKYATLDAMAEMQSDKEDPLLFARTYFPRVLYLVGCWEITSVGKVTLASAENGTKINILGVNFFDREAEPARVAGTLLHEFSHILDSTHPVPDEYAALCRKDYVGDRYVNYGTAECQALGFISPYARSSPAEDVAETCGRLVSVDDEGWESMLASIPEDGRAILQKKRSILTLWLKEDFGVDVHKWCVIHHRRVNELRDIDWETLDD